MTIAAAVCNSFKSESLQGVHAAGDTYKIALYTSTATLNKSTTAYSATNETTGTGYTAGGATLAGYAAGLSGDTAYLNWTTNPAWDTATFTARGALIYNSSKSNKAVAVIDFGGDISVAAGTFTVTMPANGTASAVTVA